ncbi:MAG: bifunctional demethylmenaquinone methyltransferase/2-methoxy-6-polyprenyl-1,4-benzoquinol methylase UbiE [Verrucomicrobiae bacterium]|nr:bifunctional demethylmenaquinone methyltransferase/2-methoxy-6-polyprenyl-1,4-benzoquinol methylase UbiE [Verrucomicrobiae bacterium]
MSQTATRDRDQDPAFVQRAFASIADRYVLTNHVLSLGIDVLWRRRVARMVAAEKPEQVLDLATGSGDLAAAVQRECGSEQTRVIGADFCAPMLRHARERGLSDLIVADGMCLPFEDDRFDAITIGYGLRNMESWQDALREMQRVLKPGGLLVILDFSLPTISLLREPYRFYLHRVLPRLGGWLTGNREAYAYLGDSIERFPAGKTMQALIDANGFSGAESIPLWGGISSIYAARAD